MSKDDTYKASPIKQKQKRKRRTKAEMQALRDIIVDDVLAAYRPMTVRQVFYQLVSRGAIPKTQRQYDAVCRILGQMRLDGQLPFDYIADSTRWMRKPTTHTGLRACLEESARFYRRDLWRQAPVYVEVWCEKDALAGVLWDVTEEYDVPLMVTRGFASLSFDHSAAQTIEAQGKPAYLYYFGDHDPSGICIDPSTERHIREFAPNADIHFERVAVTLEQIVELDLLTRPTKESDSRAKNFEGGSVELDAIPPDVLQQMVRVCIERHVDQGQLERLKTIEDAERETLFAMAEGLKR